MAERSRRGWGGVAPAGSVVAPVEEGSAGRERR